MDTSSRYRWFVVAVFFLFMLLHQADKFLIGPLTTPIMETFRINEAQMGAVSTLALLVGAILYPLWGYLYDRYARAKLLALASLIWGSTTMLNASAPSYGAFLATRASTGIDDSSYPGLDSMVADYFEPSIRGKIYGLLQVTGPLGYLLGMVLALILGGVIGWRNAFYITGSLGIVLALVIFLGVREPQRGRSEPELAELTTIRTYRFDWVTARQLFRKPALIVLFIQGFFGVFPWQVITFWIFRYLETERGYSDNEILITMSSVILVLATGYFLGGAAGDYAFKRTPRGRLIVSSIGVLLGALFLAFALNVPVAERGLFFLGLVLTAIFMPFAAPNMVSSVYDITLPEVRSTALAIQLFIENAGAATAPLLAGLIAVRADLKTALLLICTTAWVLCAIFYAVGAGLIPRDIATLRAQMRRRAELEKGGLSPSS
ncbi:MAG: MFS transporter [Chloroflexota bacterium]